MYVCPKVSVIVPWDDTGCQSIILLQRLEFCEKTIKFACLLFSHPITIQNHLGFVDNYGGSVLNMPVQNGACVID